MGYGSMTQRGIGLQTRQYARAFIIEDRSGNRVVFVNADISAFSHAMKRDVNFVPHNFEIACITKFLLLLLRSSEGSPQDFETFTQSTTLC